MSAQDRTFGFLALVLATGPAAEATDWPRWRRPNADGVVESRNLPLKWSKTENVRWSAKLLGWGISSPVDCVQWLHRMLR